MYDFLHSLTRSIIRLYTLSLNEIDFDKENQLTTGTVYNSRRQISRRNATLTMSTDQENLIGIPI